ncbi:MAG: sigma-70 family RNA polymerase sigma factor [Ornithinimicrobium sp.]
MIREDAQAADTAANPPTLTDRAAIAFTAYRGGDPQAMGQLVDLLTPLLWQTARAQSLSPVAAEDVAQTAWLRLVDHADSIEQPRAVLSWMVTTVRREAWRQHKVAGRDSADLDLQPEAAAAEPGPAHNTLLTERQRMLWQHVAELSERCKHLLQVIAFADKPDYGTIAEALKMPVGSIGPTRGRCLATLRTSLSNDPAWFGELS